MRRTQKDKSPKAQKCKMAWEWGANEYFYLSDVTILWCPSWKLPKDRVKKWNSYFWPRKSYLDFKILVSIFPNWTTLNDSKFIYLPFGKSIFLKEFNMIVYCLTVCYLRRKLSRDLGPPGSRQLLQLQLFSPNFLKFWSPPHDLGWILEPFGHAWVLMVSFWRLSFVLVFRNYSYLELL